ncbi:MAG: tetratricopeptide repeat protein, partial [Bacteroidetes bacterium]|nr:tetratricopeptide repeat protein [Bacteroidota bacterium]
QHKGQIEKAEKLQLEALNIRRQLGDMKGISTSLAIIGHLNKEKGDFDKAVKLYLESIEIKKQLGDKKGISSSLFNLGNLYRDKNKIEEAETIHLEALEIRRQSDDKKGICASLAILGHLSKDIGNFEKAEKLYLESLELKRELNDKKGISALLVNLGVCYFEMDNDKKAIKCFNESIVLKREINTVSSLVATIHRLFSLLDSNAQNGYNSEIDKLDKSNLNTNEMCWLKNIELIYVCHNDVSNDTAVIQKISKQIIDLTKKLRTNDIDDLPVEAFYVAAKKLIQLNSTKQAKSLAKQALNWIGNRKTRRKEELEKMLK